HTRDALSPRLDLGLGRADGDHHGRRLSDRSGEPRGRAMTAALALIALAALAALALGLVARGGRDMDLEQWAVGGRGFGWILVFLLLAGEIYTTFTFLGASGFSYGLGAPVYYILAYGSLAYVIAYFLLPLVWSYGGSTACPRSRISSFANMRARRSACWSRSSIWWR